MQSPIRYNFARPNMSASRPPSNRKPPKVTAYPLTSHCNVVVATWRPCWIEGSATLTIVKSSTTMNWAIAKVTRSAVPALVIPGAAPCSLPGIELLVSPALATSPPPASSFGLGRGLGGESAGIKRILRLPE